MTGRPDSDVAGTSRRLSRRVHGEVDDVRVEPLRHRTREVVQPVAHDQPFVQLVHVVLALDQRRYRSPYLAERLRPYAVQRMRAAYEAEREVHVATPLQGLYDEELVKALAPLEAVVHIVDGDAINVKLTG